MKLSYFSDELFVELCPFQVTLGTPGSTGMENVKVRNDLLYLLYINIKHKLCRMSGSDLGIKAGSIYKLSADEAKHYPPRPKPLLEPPGKMSVMNWPMLRLVPPNNDCAWFNGTMRPDAAAG